MERPRLLLFDPYSGGHHGDHLLWLAEAWRARALPGRLVLSLASATLDEHPALRSLAGPTPAGRVDLDVLLGAEAVQEAPSLVASARHHVRLVQGVLARLAPERFFAMYLDHAQVALALRRRAGPTRCSGLLFRPDLHLASAPGLRARLRRARKRALLRALMSSPGFETLFTLDPTAVPALQALAPGCPIVAVPDPAHADAPSLSAGAVRARYGVDAGRRLFVLPGALDDRKGIFLVLDALATLPAETQQRLAIVFAGHAPPAAADRFAQALASTGRGTAAHLVWDRRFLPGPELQALVAAADVVLAPYQHHVGSSGIVMRAAAAGRPLVAQAEGLMGWQVRTHHLGQTVASGDRNALAHALAEGVRDPEAGLDARAAAGFASGHTVEAYTSAILEGLGIGRGQEPPPAAVSWR